MELEDVVRLYSATPARRYGLSPTKGALQIGSDADFVLIDQNPLENFKVLYGTGALRYDPATGKSSRIGGINYTIKDGIVYDAKGLLKEVARMVDEAKRRKTTTTQ